MTEIKRRRREERLRYFVPTAAPNNDQIGFLASPAKIRAVFGGNRSGKTEIGVVDAIKMMLGEHPRSNKHNPPVHIRYLAPSYEDGIKAIILKKFKELCPRHLLAGGKWEAAWSEKSRTLKTSNGSQCRFFSYEQDVNKMGGADVDMVYLDEHAPLKVFQENLMRTVDRDGGIVLTMTPEAGITWEEEAIIEAAEHDEEIDFWFFSTYGNPHLSKAGIEAVEKLITDERLRDAKLHGRFVALSGLVYPQFSRKIHVIDDSSVELPANWHRQFVIDPHHRKPSAMLWRAVDPDGISYVYREAEFSPASGGVSELANFIRQRSATDKISDWIIDEAMGGKGLNIMGQHSVAEQLRAEGIPVNPTNKASEQAFAAGVNRVRSKLQPDPVTQKPTHYVFESCRKTWRQYERYRYKKETKADEETLREHVRNVDDDFVTCDRYGASAEPRDYLDRHDGPQIVRPDGPLFSHNRASGGFR